MLEDLRVELRNVIPAMFDQQRGRSAERRPSANLGQAQELTVALFRRAPSWKTMMCRTEYALAKHTQGSSGDTLAG